VSGAIRGGLARELFERLGRLFTMTDVLKLATEGPTGAAARAEVPHLREVIDEIDRAANVTVEDD
jgi:hypothetical protein